MSTITGTFSDRNKWISWITNFVCEIRSIIQGNNENKIAILAGRTLRRTLRQLYKERGVVGWRGLVVYGDPTVQRSRCWNGNATRKDYKQRRIDKIETEEQQCMVGGWTIERVCVAVMGGWMAYEKPKEKDISPISQAEYVTYGHPNANKTRFRGKSNRYHTQPRLRCNCN